ncbi:MAG: HAD family hydrolase, partial [Candidatus Acidiferrales bacterium]
LRTRVCGGDLEEKKPHPAPLQMALRQMALEPAECVYVGDTPEDVEMARAAGVRAIAVLGSFPTERRLRAVRPEFLLDDLRKLPELLRELYGEARRARTRS